MGVCQRTMGLNLLIGPLESNFESFVIRWLEQVVDRFHFERSNGPVVVGRDKDDFRDVRILSAFQNFDASGNSRGTRNVYSNNGYLLRVEESAIIDNVRKTYYTIEEQTARGQIKAVKLGNDYRVNQGFDAVRTYIENVLVITHGSFEDHIEKLDLTFSSRIQQAGLKINVSKCKFAKTELEYLG